MKEINIISHISIILVEYMNQNRKIFELWMKYVSVWPNLTHKIKIHTFKSKEIRMHLAFQLNFHAKEINS
jgi:hypothetical protein